MENIKSTKQKKLIDRRDMVSRKDYDDLWVSYHQLKENFNDRVVEAVKLFKEQQKAKNEIRISYEESKKLKEDFEWEQSQRKYWEDTANELKKVLEEKETQFIEVREAKNKTIRLLNENCIVLTEEIIRLKEGKK